MRIILALAFLVSGLQARLQTVNLVANGDFELALPSASTHPNNAAVSWSGIDTTFPAYYYINWPTPPTGYQLARSGKAYIGTSFYSCNTCDRWYPRNRLKNNLESSISYCARYFVVNTNNNRVAIDAYGLYSVDSSLDTITTYGKHLVYLNPQVQHPSGNIITDTLNWTAISGTFVAQGGEKYLVLGNFLSNAATNTLLINTPTYVTMFNDIYIDDVSLIELELLAFAGDDRSLVPGDSTWLGRELEVGLDDNVVWYKLPDNTNPIGTGAGLWVKPTSTSTYAVKQDLCGTIKWDTVMVFEDAVGVKDMSLLRLQISPNPCDQLLNISRVQKTVSYSLVNAVGQRLQIGSLEQGENAISTSELSPGIYYLQLIGDEGRSVTKKIFVQR